MIVPRPGHTVDVEAVRALCAAALSYYKVPEHWEVREGALPRNAAGKILKDLLRDARADTGFSAAPAPASCGRPGERP